MESVGSFRYGRSVHEHNVGIAVLYRDLRGTDTLKVDNHGRAHPECTSRIIAPLRNRSPCLSDTRSSLEDRFMLRARLQM